MHTQTTEELSHLHSLAEGAPHGHQTRHMHVLGLLGQSVYLTRACRTICAQRCVPCSQHQVRGGIDVCRDLSDR